MSGTLLPADELQRQRALDRYAIVDTAPEPQFDRLARLLATALDAPTALITFIDGGRQWFKARHGFVLPETDRSIAFCAHTVLAPGPLVVADTLTDPRFATNPLVAGPPFVRFYAGAPIVAPDGQRVGAVAVLDQRPRSLTPAQQDMLGEFASLVSGELERRLRDATVLREELSRKASLAAGELQKATERYEIVVRATSDAVWDWNLLDGSVWWSASVEPLLGYPPEELARIGDWVAGIHDADRQRVSDGIHAAIDSGAADWSDEYRFRRKDGSWADILDRGRVIRDEGKPVRMIGAMMDQSARKRGERAQAALYKIAEASGEASSLRELLSTIHRIIATLTFAPNLYVALYDERRQVLEFPYWSDEHDPPSGPEPLGRGLTEYVLRTGAALLVSDRNSFEALAAQGEVDLIGAPSQSWLGVPLRAHERTVGVLAAQIYRGELRYGPRDLELLQFVSTQVAHAIEHKRAEEALRASELRFRAMIEHSSDGIAILDRELSVVYQSPSVQRITGKLSKGAFDVVHADDVPRLAEMLGESVRRPAEPQAFSVRVVLPDSALRQIEGVCTNLLEDPAVRGLVINFRDVTDRKQMEARLMMADRMVSVGTLAAGVAHEINNPLAYVLANLGFVLEGLAATPPMPAHEVAGLAREARDGAERVRKIVRDLKTFSRGDEEAVGPVDLRAVLDASANLAWNEVRHRARLVKDYAADLPEAQGTEARLAQVFLNLIVNAAQAVSVGAADRNEIRISAMTAGGKVRVAVKDTGSGIQHGDLRRIFDPFFTTKPAGEGTGLGLFICQNIVASFGGRIEVETEPGKGTTFTVELPIAAGARPQPPISSPGPAARPGRVLIVDDEQYVASALKRLLVRHAVTVETEATAALARIRGGERFDVILCDLMMPRMSGMELFQALQAEAPDQATRMVFMTGGAFTAAARDFLDAVPNPQISKPFDGQVLRALIDERLRGK